MTEKRVNLIARFGKAVASLLVLAAFLIAVNVLVDGVSLRWDLTEGDIHTISESSCDILRELDGTVTLRYYFSRDVEGMPMALQIYAGRVEDLLREYKMAGGGNLELERLNPQPDTEVEDAALMDGIQRQSLRGGTPFYFGLAIIHLDEVVSIPALSPGRANLLEFDITRGIHRVLHPQRPTLGVLSSLPVNGPVFDPADPNAPARVEARDPWYFMQSLKEDYEVRMLDWRVERIPEEIDVLLVIHPKTPDPRLEFAMDQYVLRGGRLLLFLDPFNLYEQMQNRRPGMPPPSSSALANLLSAWGVEFQPGQVLADMTYRSRTPDGAGGMQEFPAVLALDASAMDQGDVTTVQLDGILIPYGGAVLGQGREGLERTVLLQSSTESQLVNAFGIHGRTDEIMTDFQASGERLPVAVRLTGRFTTAFPNGPPSSSEETRSDQASPGKAGDAPDSSVAALSEAEADGAVVIVADADFLYDAVCVQRVNILGRPVVRMISDNLHLFDNLVEQLAGGTALIGLRSRETGYRPFKVLEKSRDEAAEQYRSRIDELESLLAETQQRLRELEVRKTVEGRFEATPEQRRLIEEAQAKELEIRLELRDLRRNLKKAESKLEVKLEFLNIALVPILVALAGVTVGILRIWRKKSK